MILYGSSGFQVITRGVWGEASKIMKLKNKPALYDRGFTLWSPVLPRAPCVWRSSETEQSEVHGQRVSRRNKVELSEGACVPVPEVDGHGAYAVRST